MLIVPVLMATAWSDLRRMLIPNSFSLIGLGLFLASFPLLGLETWLVHLAVGATAFAICFGLFVAGWFGGGDAKMLPVSMLFVPFGILPLYMYAFAASMLLGMSAIWAVRQRLARPDADWISMQTGAAFPMGIAIATALPLTFLIAFLL